METSMEVESKTKKCPYRSTARRMFYLGVVPSQDVQPAGFLVCHGCVERPRGRWLIALRAPFELASPLGFHITHIPKGKLVYILLVRGD